MSSLRKCLTLIAVVLLAVPPGPALADNVDLALAVLVDVSGSVDVSEFGTMRDGYVNAFRDDALVERIQMGDYGRIAVSYGYWSGAAQQDLSVGWTVISDDASAEAFADAVAAYVRPFSGSTAPGSAINWAVPELFTGAGANTLSAVGHTANHWTIDISGDGIRNDGDDTATARDNAIAAGIGTINGITISIDVPTLPQWYTDNVIAGTNANGQPAFVRDAATFADIEPTIRAKLKDEAILGQDWGDLPDVYGMTTLAQDGARHAYGSQEWLGTMWDYEADGQPSDGSIDDDFDGLRDEDGVAFDAANGQYVVTVSTADHTDTNRYDAADAAMQLYLDGFIDLNSDGDFDDAG